MEKVTCSTKRKKRRTRRCLDEIRNRLRLKCGNSFEHSINSLKNTKSCTSESRKLENRLVTTDRLTLKAMFPNAVRSETITRPVLEEIKLKQNVDISKDSAVKKSTLPSNQEYSCLYMNTSASFHNIPFSEYDENSLFIGKNYKNEIKSTKGLVLSPAGLLDNAATLNKSVNEVNTSTSSQTSQDYRNHRYENLMNEIPSYIKHLASDIDKEDATKKTINNLQKLYMESCQKECEENVKKKVNSRHVLTSKKIGIGNQSIVENPLDYIRLEYEREQNRGSPLESLSDSPCLGDDGVVHSPAPTPYARPGLHVGIVPYDTPDYNYYPHRLK